MTSRLAARCLEADKAATPGPWYSVPVLSAGTLYAEDGAPEKSWGDSSGRVINGPPQTIEGDTLGKRWFAKKEDGDLIVLYRTACPELAAEVIRLRDVLSLCLEAIEHADTMSMPTEQIRAALTHEGSDR